METAILDEDPRRLQPAHNNSGDINSGNVCFQRLRIDCGFFGPCVERDSGARQKVKIGMITDQRKNLRSRNGFFATTVLYDHSIWLDANHMAIKHRANLTSANSILNVRLHPIFQTPPHLGTAMYDGHMCA